MLEKKYIKWVYGICAMFIVLNSICIINEIYWFSLVPILLLLTILYVFSLDVILLMIVFSTPLSINLSDFEFNLGISLPAEPMLIGVMVLFIIRVIYSGRFDWNVLKHPVSIAIFAYLFWIFLTSITSSFPIVSIKYLVSKLWFIIPCYFLGTQLFRNYRNMRKFVWMYLISFLIVIIYTINRHSSYGFNEETSHWVMEPFYNDHTAYGALLAMFLPFTLGFSFDKTYNKTQRLFSFIVFIIFFIATILSYGRATWISLAVAFCFYLVLKLKIDFRLILTGVLLMVGVYFLFRTEIIMKLAKNKQDSSQDYMEHIQSMSNISTDASNLERINRWQSALRMFSERPIFGWGPGTYQFNYAPFQRSQERTIISTNIGNRGNAHSEYIGPLAEMGFMGLLTLLSIIAFVTYTAVKLFKSTTSSDVKYLSLIIIISLYTYFVNGVLNNFLDSDKASVPFWGFIAMIVALDVYHKDKINPK